jgi:hypothetical protein
MNEAKTLTEFAEMLGIGRPTLHYMVARTGVEPVKVDKAPSGYVRRKYYSIETVLAAVGKSRVVRDYRQVRSLVEVTGVPEIQIRRICKALGIVMRPVMLNNHMRWCLEKADYIRLRNELIIGRDKK